MSDEHGNNPYHLVEPSHWPVVGATAGLLLTFGMVLSMHPGAFGPKWEPLLGSIGYWKLLPGGLLAATTMIGWWRNVIDEATFRKLHGRIVQIGLRYGMTLFIASEVMFFSAFFWAFFDASLYPKAATGGVWPPHGITTFNAFDLPLLNTLILLTSGFTVTWAHHDIRENKMSHASMMLGLTVLLGLCFTSLQAFEYSHAPFAFRDGIYPTTFFLATGFHGFHVIVGTIFLAVTWMRCARGDFEPDHHFGFEAAAWYWHFVDVVWLFLFVFVYVWGGGSHAG